MSGWIFPTADAPRLPRRLLLLGSERVEHEGHLHLAPVEALDLVSLEMRFGVADPRLAALHWRWVCEREVDADAKGATYATEDVEPHELAGLALVNAAMGARVPLAMVPDLVGREVTREGCIALGFLNSAEATKAAPPSALIDAAEAAQILGITEAALRSRLARGEIPNASVKRTGRRVQYIRARLQAWVEDSKGKR